MIMRYILQKIKFELIALAVVSATLNCSELLVLNPPKPIQQTLRQKAFDIIQGYSIGVLNPVFRKERNLQADNVELWLQNPNKFQLEELHNHCPCLQVVRLPESLYACFVLMFVADRMKVKRGDACRLATYNSQSEEYLSVIARYNPANFLKCAMLTNQMVIDTTMAAGLVSDLFSNTSEEAFNKLCYDFVFQNQGLCELWWEVNAFILQQVQSLVESELGVSTLNFAGLVEDPDTDTYTLESCQAWREQLARRLQATTAKNPGTIISETASAMKNVLDHWDGAPTSIRTVVAKMNDILIAAERCPAVVQPVIDRSAEAIVNMMLSKVRELPPASFYNISARTSPPFAGHESDCELFSHFLLQIIGEERSMYSSEELASCVRFIRGTRSGVADYVAASRGLCPISFACSPGTGWVFDILSGNAAMLGLKRGEILDVIVPRKQLIDPGTPWFLPSLPILVTICSSSEFHHPRSKVVDVFKTMQDDHDTNVLSIRGDCERMPDVEVKVKPQCCGWLIQQDGTPFNSGVCVCITPFGTSNPYIADIVTGIKFQDAAIASQKAVAETATTQPAQITTRLFEFWDAVAKCGRAEYPREFGDLVKAEFEAFKSRSRWLMANDGVIRLFSRDDLCRGGLKTWFDPSVLEQLVVAESSND
ncbi:MAG: hypothetical protein LBD36_03160 [Holosporales bacterium]|jgi:hypothetical protein|nr:hypothetical protein [Holosporales bacterium]